MPSSAWAEYFDALDEHLAAVVAADGGWPVAPLVGLTRHPAGPLPAGQAPRWRQASAALDAMIETTERRRDDVADRLRSMRRRTQVSTRRTSLIRCEL